MTHSRDIHEQRVQMAARALARGGLVSAFGHCSERLTERSFLVCAARPLGLITASDPGTVVTLDDELPAGVLGEVRIHREIYRRRPEINGICRVASPHVLALSALGLAPRARHGFGAYFYPTPPRWPGTALVRDDATACLVADVLAAAPALVLGVNGSVTVGTSLERSVALAWFLEDAARVELAVRSAAGAEAVTFHSAEEAAARATWDGRIAERVWEFLTSDRT